MLTTADAPAHDEERERDRLSLQNHVISFSNETLDEVKETILETPKWKFQRGDDAGGMQPLCNTVHFSLSPLIHAQKKKPRPFSLYNVFDVVGLLLVCPYDVGRAKDHSDNNHRPLSLFCLGLFLFFLCFF